MLSTVSFPDQQLAACPSCSYQVLLELLDRRLDRPAVVSQVSRQGGIAQVVQIGIVGDLTTTLAESLFTKREGEKWRRASRVRYCALMTFPVNRPDPASHLVLGVGESEFYLLDLSRLVLAFVERHLG
jgi:hypothetical protein